MHPPRSRGTTEAPQPASDEDEVPAEVREVPAPPPSRLEFEGRVQEVKQVGYRSGNALRRQISAAELTTVTSPQKEEMVSIVNAEPTRATGFFITRATPSDRSQRVFVVNAVTSTETAVTETAAAATEVPSTTTETPTTLEEATTAMPETTTTQAPPRSTSTSTRIVTSITELPNVGRTIITVHRKLYKTPPSTKTYVTSPLTTPVTTPMTTLEVTEVPTTTFVPELEEIVTEPSTTTTTKSQKRPLLRRRPSSYSPKPVEETSSFKPSRIRRPPVIVRNNLEETVTESADVSTRRFNRQRLLRVTSPASADGVETSTRRFSRKRVRVTTKSDTEESSTEAINSVSLETATEAAVRSTRRFSRKRLTTTRPDIEETATEASTRRFTSRQRNRLTTIPTEESNTTRPRRRKIVRVRTRTTTTTASPEESYEDNRSSASGNEVSLNQDDEVFLTSSSQHNGPDEVVIEDNEILTATTRSHEVKP